MSDCLFCKIRDGKVPATLVHQDDLCLAFDDINPMAPSHALVIPRQHLATLNDAKADDRLLLGHLVLTAAKIAAAKGLAETGYRVVVNTNRAAGQTVFHVHVHVLGGRALEWPPG